MRGLKRLVAIGAVVLVAGVLFSTGCASKGNATSDADAKAAAERTAATPVFDAFARVDSDLNVGISFNDYARRLQDVNFALESFKPSTPQGDIAKARFQKALRYYIAAREAWNWEIQGGWPQDQETANHWAGDYPEVVLDKDYVRPKDVRQAAWDVARKTVVDARNALGE